MDDPDNPHNQPDDLEKYARALVGLVGDDRRDRALLDRVHALLANDSKSTDFIRERNDAAVLIQIGSIANALEDLVEIQRSAQIQASMNTAFEELRKSEKRLQEKVSLLESTNEEWASRASEQNVDAMRADLDRLREKVSEALRCSSFASMREVLLDAIGISSPWPVERVTEPRHGVKLTVGKTTSGMSPAEARALAAALIEAAASPSEGTP
jgi:hypothetical protein